MKCLESSQDTVQFIFPPIPSHDACGMGRRVKLRRDGSGHTAALASDASKPVAVYIYLSACLSLCLSDCLPVCLSVRLSVCLSLYLSVCLFLCISLSHMALDAANKWEIHVVDKQRVFSEDPEAWLQSPSMTLTRIAR